MHLQLAARGLHEEAIDCPVAEVIEAGDIIYGIFVTGLPGLVFVVRSNLHHAKGKRHAGLEHPARVARTHQEVHIVGILVKRLGSQRYGAIVNDLLTHQHLETLFTRRIDRRHHNLLDALAGLNQSGLFRLATDKGNLLRAVKLHHLHQDRQQVLLLRLLVFKRSGLHRGDQRGADGNNLQRFRAREPDAVEHAPTSLDHAHLNLVHAFVQPLGGELNRPFLREVVLFSRQEFIG